MRHRCVSLQVRAMMTESAFSIEELEELYCLFKVRRNFKMFLNGSDLFVLCWSVSFSGFCPLQVSVLMSLLL